VWFDSHCHVFESDEPEAEIERAREAGVNDMLVAGTDLATSRAAIALADRHGMGAAAGVHPHESSGWNEGMAAAVEVLVAHPRVVAVGESGLDFYREVSPHECQRAAFEAHIELARRTGKALVVHTRASVGDALDALEEIGSPRRVVFHCWSGDGDELQRALGIGAYISFAGNVTFANAHDLRARAAQVPNDRLVIETDSPYLAPVPYRGRPNQPALLPLVGEAVARARTQRVEELSALTTANARRLYENR
jgi:TatD DNase family protein